jgi:hypothetical protein
MNPTRFPPLLSALLAACMLTACSLSPPHPTRLQRPRPRHRPGRCKPEPGHPPGAAKPRPRAARSPPPRRTNPTQRAPRSSWKKPPRSLPSSARPGCPSASTGKWKVASSAVTPTACSPSPPQGQGLHPRTRCRRAYPRWRHPATRQPAPQVPLLHLPLSRPQHRCNIAKLQ